jgi:hypothetical protein
MSRRSFLAAIGIFALLGAVVLGCILLMIRFEPQFYERAPIQPIEKQREEDSRTVLREVTALISVVNNTATEERDWEHNFTDEQINGFLSKGFVTSGLSKTLLPEGVSDPRVVFEDDRIHLAFRYKRGLLCTVISMDLKVWLARAEPNVVAVQLEGFRAGVLPIGSHWLMELVSEIGRQNNVDINWYRHEGLPVALIRFQPDQPTTSLQIQTVKIAKRSITIQGKSNGPQGHADLRLPEELQGGRPKAEGEITREMSFPQPPRD